MDKHKLAALLRRPEFWCGVVANASTAAVELAPVAWIHHLGVVVLSLTGIAALIAAGCWDPPRVPWNNETRIKHGLPPLPEKSRDITE